jgi:molybdopterin-containing oxidoreductase family membrane subunit
VSAIKDFEDSAVIGQQAFQVIGKASPRYYGLAAAAAVVLGLGLIAAWYMEHHGHWVTGMDNQVVWGLPHVFAVFLIVAASGVLNIASISSVFGQAAYKPLARLSGLMAIALLLGGLAVLVLDLGRPDRLIIAMTSFNFRSIFAWNIFLYTGFIAIVAIYLWLLMERRMAKWSGKAGLLAFIWRLVLTTGTGCIFGFLVAREAYDSAIMAPLFIAMSLAFGLAIFMLALAACYGREAALGGALGERMARLLVIFVAAVLYFTFLQHLTGLYGARSHGIELYLLFDGGAVTAIFWLLQVGAGGIAPLLLLLWPVSGQRPAGSSAAAAALVVLGGLAQIYVIIIGGQSYPLNLFPGYETSSSFFDGAVAGYAPSLPEFVLGLGGFALAAMIVMLGLRILPILPLSLVDKAVDPPK